jgi:uncharacterized protein (TIGR03435 family)
MRTRLGFVLAAFLVIPTFAQGPVFDVVSIKPSAPNSQSFGMRAEPGRLVATRTTIRSLILYAYPTEGRAVLGGPDWVGTDFYDVQATTGRPATVDELRAMVRTMLSDRLRLVVSTQKVERDAYDMVLARKVPGALRRIDRDCEAERLKPPPADVEAIETVASNGALVCRRSALPGGGGWRSGGSSMDELAGWLWAPEPDGTGRMVINKTGLQGYYTFSVRYASPERRIRTGDDAPPLLIAIEEQLGIKLVPKKLPVEVVVIESIERPTSN